MELLISVIVGILIVEAYVWLPKISEWLIERAVQRLRSEDQVRCREEWKAGLDALPNTVIKLVHALSYRGAARRINADFFENKLNEINALIEECVHKHSGAVVSYGAWKETLGILHRLKLDLQLARQKLDLQLSGMKARVMEAPNEEVASSFQKAVTTLETVAETTFEKCAASASKIGLQAGLLTVSVDKSIERLNHVKGLILRGSEKRNQVTALLGQRDVSPDMLDTLLGELASDLHTVKDIFEDANWGDDDSFEELKRIMAQEEAERSSILLQEWVRSMRRLNIRARATLTLIETTQTREPPPI